MKRQMFDLKVFNEDFSVSVFHSLKDVPRRELTVKQWHLTKTIKTAPESCRFSSEWSLIWIWFGNVILQLLTLVSHFPLQLTLAATRWWTTAPVTSHGAWWCRHELHFPRSRSSLCLTSFLAWSTASCREMLMEWAKVSDYTQGIEAKFCCLCSIRTFSRYGKYFHPSYTRTVFTELSEVQLSVDFLL